jgi:UDP-N-acetylglucosamine 4-epimerase
MKYADLGEKISTKTQRWLVTGASGFIGSHLTEFLLNHNQFVTGLDNFSTSSASDFQKFKQNLSPDAQKRFSFYEADIRDLKKMISIAHEHDYVIHQAALGSVPRSVEDPIATHDSNVTGTLNMLVAAEKAKVKKFVFASSSSVYGDSQVFPQLEPHIGSPLSPYAVSKRTCELYGLNFAHVYNLPVIGLRYFNVFGPRQRPDGPYAAVIPRWIAALMKGEQTLIHGDGETSRDFCFVKNVVQANVLGAITENPESNNQLYNIALGGSTSLNELHQWISAYIEKKTGSKPPAVQNGPFRKGDIRHSKADVTKAQTLLGYTPEFQVREGLAETIESFLNQT